MKTVLIISLILFLLFSTATSFSGNSPLAFTYSESRQTDVANYLLNFTFQEESNVPVIFNVSSSLEGVVVSFNYSLINVTLSPQSISMENDRSILIPYYTLPSNLTPLKVKLKSEDLNGTLTVKVIQPHVNITSFIENSTNHTTSPHQSERQADFNDHYLVLLFIIPLIVYILLVYVNKRK